MKILPFHAARGCLSYLVIDPDSNEAALIDPSEEIADETYITALKESGMRLRYIIETHTHADHVSSAHSLMKKTSARIVRHALAPSPVKDVAVTGGEELPLGKRTLYILATPGHTNESISIVSDGAVFTGDVLLRGGTGRTDLQGGDSEAMYHSLHESLGGLPDTTVVYPAHDYRDGISSTIGEQKRLNPRFVLPHDAFVQTMNAHHPPLPDLFDEAIVANSR